jgi:hypothetical protein
LVLQNSWGLGVGLTTPSRKTIIVTKPSGRPKPTQGCSAEEEEEEHYLTPWSRVLKKLIVALTVKILSAF